MIATITGKLIRENYNNEQYYSDLMIPAEDEYSFPSTMQIRSKQKIGSLESEVTIKVKVGGYAQRERISVNRETGERRAWVPVTNTLDYVETVSKTGSMPPLKSATS